MQEKVEELLNRGVAEVIDQEDLKNKLLSGQKLRVKLGIDPTSPNIHLGRSIPLLKLKDFQDLGHQIVFIIGDFTGVIGDTSDKDSERPILSQEVVNKNLEHYQEQAGKIIDLSKCEIYRNSEWFGQMSYLDLLMQTENLSLNDFIARENIDKRISLGKHVSVRELLYPVMQGFDSVQVRADVEVGGTDQKFNLLTGRQMQKIRNLEPQNIVTNHLIEGLDGRKMSSSWGNTINLTDEPEEMYGKILSLRDDLIIKYLELLTRVSLKKVAELDSDLKNGTNPKTVKMFLALEIVKMYHGVQAAEAAAQNFENTFVKGEFPENAVQIKTAADAKLVDVLVGANLIESKSEFRRLVDSGAISDFMGEKLTDPNQLVGEAERKMKIGKRLFLVINPKK